MTQSTQQDSKQDKFTPGEWEVQISKGTGIAGLNQYQIKDENNLLIATAYGSTNEEVEANARLIAAAPEMYNALKVLADFYDQLPESRKQQGGNLFGYNDTYLSVEQCKIAKEIINRINQ